MNTINEIINELKNIIIIEAIYYDKSFINNVSFDTLSIKINKNVDYINNVASIDLFEKVSELKRELTKLYEERNKYAEFVSKTNTPYNNDFVNNSTNKIIELENKIIQEEIISKNNYDLIINENIEKIDELIKKLYELKVKFHINITDSIIDDPSISRLTLFERKNEENTKIK